MPDPREDLDEEQRNAVEAPEFAIAVLAGPGRARRGRWPTAPGTCCAAPVPAVRCC